MADDDEDNLLYKNQRRHLSRKRWWAKQLIETSTIVGLLAGCIMFGLLFCLHKLHRQHARIEARLEPYHEHARFLANLSNPAADPCTDFYEYSCGGWLSRATIPADQRGVSMWSPTIDRIEQQLQDIAEQGWPYVGTWYRACLNQEARLTHGTSAVQPLLDLIEQASLPADLPDLLATLHLSGVRAVFSGFVGQDEFNPPTSALQVYYPLVMAPPGTNPEARTAVVDLVARLMNGDRSSAELAFSFEQDLLVPAMMPASERGNCPAEWLDFQLGGFDWVRYWNASMPDHWTPPGRFQALDPDFVRHVSGPILGNATVVQLRAYLQYVVLMTFVDAFPNASALLAPLNRAAGGQQASASPEHTCLISTERAFGNLLSHYYVRRYFSNTTEFQVGEVVDALIVAFGQRLHDSTWLDTTTRQRALAKLAAMRVVIGQPDHWSAALPPDWLDEDDYLGNVLEHWRWGNLANRMSWMQAPALDEEWWDMDLFDVNAEFIPTANGIMFPAGILQTIFFNASLPLAVNFGAFGTVAGHEITHGYDDEGRQYDATGARRDWWTAEAAEAFEERAQCVVDLYSSFETPAGPVDGELTEGENLADLGGLATAYTAYQLTLKTVLSKRQRDSYQRAIRHEYHMTDDQLFFRSWATMWCGERTPQFAELLLHQDPHAPYKWRVNGPASQSAEFAKAFDCPIPTDVCLVW